MKKNNLLIFFVGVLFTFSVAMVVYKTESSRKIVRPIFEKASFGEKDDPIARSEYENRMLVDPATGKIPANIREKELKFASTLPKAEEFSLLKGNKTAALTWNARGPINRGGRTRALGIDVRTQTPGNVTIIAGGVSGGIWKSTDDGTTWVNKLSPSLIHNSTCIAQDTRTGHEDTWYVGTGEAYGNSASASGAAFRGDGIFKSIDNGETWTLLSNTTTGQPQTYTTATPFKYVADVAVNKTTGSVFAAAGNTIRRSTNGGTDWTAVRGSFTSGIASDVQITSTGVIYAAIPSGYTDGGIWRSTDDGGSWTSIIPSTFPATYGRPVIGIAPSNENVVYFWVYTGSGASGTSLWKYTYPGSGNGAGDANWVDLTANLPTSIGGSVGDMDVQGSYDMIIKVKPDDPNFVVIGGTNLYRTTNGFTTQIGSAGWIGGYATVNNVSQYANHHPDQHSFVFLTSNPKITYSGHDGGISRTTDITASPVTWTSLNTGYVTSQFYSVAIDPTTANDNTIIGGLQDNGNYFTNSSSFTSPWVELPLGGDGGFTEITGGHTDYYFETQNGSVWRFLLDPNGNYTNFAKVKPNYATHYLFINPFVLDPNDNKVMYLAAGDSVWRNSDLTGIPLGNQSTTSVNWSALKNSYSGYAVTAIGVSKTPANRIYVGSSGGTILRIDGANDPNAASTDVSTGKGLPIGYVSCIIVNPANADQVIVVFSNYNIPSLFATTDGGSNWQDISGNLEQYPDGSGNGPSCRWAGYYDDGVNGAFFVATSTGLYSTTNLNGSSTVWTQEGASTIGNQVCTMVRVRQSDGTIVVGTHGSGVYSAKYVKVAVDNSTSSIPTSYALSQNYPNPFNPSTTINFALPSPNHVKLAIYDAAGRKVKEVVNRDYEAGDHSVKFDASNLASGIYFYRIEAGSFVESKKMVLLK